MRKHLRALALFCLFLAVCLLICACNGEGNPTGSSTATTGGGAPSGSTTTSAGGGNQSPQGSSTTSSQMGDNNKPDENGNLTYTVSVLDANGKAVEDVIVHITAADGESDMELVDADGKATFLLPAGAYTVTVDSLEGEYYYDTDAATLSAEKTSLTVTLYGKTTEYELYHVYGELGSSMKSQRVYSVGEGTTYVRITRGNDRTYFLFTPTRGGIYRISLTSGEEFTIGCYGNPISALKNSTLDQTENYVDLEVFNSSIGEGGITAQFLVGIYMEGSGRTDGLLKIERIADSIPGAAEALWEDYRGTCPRDEFFLSYDNHTVTVTDLDITDANLTVVLGADGYYHLGTADGPLVYIRLTTPSPYVASFMDICATTAFGSYFYDDEGVFTHKEMYNLMLEEYAALCDPLTGLYPLNADLAYAVQMHGEHAGWWKLSKPTSLFEGVAAEPTVAWLFACCTVTVEENKGTADTPATLLEAGRALLSAGESVVYNAVRNAGDRLVITDAAGVLTLTVNGTEYTAENGKITVTLPADATTFTVTAAASAEGDVEVIYTVSELA